MITSALLHTGTERWDEYAVSHMAPTYPCQRGIIVQESDTANSTTVDAARGLAHSEPSAPTSRPSRIYRLIEQGEAVGPSWPAMVERLIDDYPYSFPPVAVPQNPRPTHPLESLPFTLYPLA
jgi:hypothetical protein